MNTATHSSGLAPSLVLTVLVGLLLSGCTPSVGQGWLPLDVGLRHEYAVTQVTEEMPAEQRWTLALLRTE